MTARPSIPALDLARAELLARAVEMPEGEDRQAVLAVAHWLDDQARLEFYAETRRAGRRALKRSLDLGDSHV